jgi:hypothetical protein
MILCHHVARHSLHAERTFSQQEGTNADILFELSLVVAIRHIVVQNGWLFDVVWFRCLFRLSIEFNVKGRCPGRGQFETVGPIDHAP